MKVVMRLLFFWFLSALPACALALPERPQGYVSDFAGVIDPGAETELASMISRTQRETTAEIAVVTVFSLEDLTVEDYAERLFKAWGIGKKGQDNGVLILVAPSERKARIEVGYGLEARLPDGAAGEIIRRDMLPAFKRGDFNGGLLAGTRSVADIVAGRRAAGGRGSTGAPGGDIGTAMICGLLYLALLFFGGMALGAGHHRLVPALDGIGLSSLVFGFAAYPAALAWLLPALISGLASTLFGFLAVRGGGYGGLDGGSRGGGDWGGGGFSGGSDFGGFGGGCSGGGGASGSW